MSTTGQEFWKAVGQKTQLNFLTPKEIFRKFKEFFEKLMEIFKKLKKSPTFCWNLLRKNVQKKPE